MKKFYAIALTTALAVTLCGCVNSGEGGGKNIHAGGVSRGDEEFERYVAALPDADIPMPDGSTRRKGDVDRTNENGLMTFDTAYIRFPNARFESTLDDPGLFDKENFEFRSEVGGIGDIEWIPVKAGDVLENGLVVESAFTTPEYEYPFTDDTINFCGTITALAFSGEFVLEGILKLYPGSENYNYVDSCVTFIPDSTKLGLPIPYSGYAQEYGTVVDIDTGNALIYDGARFEFGNLDEAGYDFGADTPIFSKVRMTLKAIRSLPDGCYTGEITGCEILS